MRNALIAAALLAAGPAVAQDLPAPVPTNFVFEENATLAPALILGETPLGRRQAIPITGGSFAGPGVHGRILPGGADYQTVRSDGGVVIDADYFLETDDHVVIHVRNVGLIIPPKGPGQAAYPYAAPKFDAPNGKYGWLNDSLFVSRISPGGDKDHPAVKITIWKVG